MFLTDSGAQFHTAMGRGGTALKSDIRLPLDFERPTGTNSWVITWDVWWSEAFNIVVNDRNEWSSAKHMNITAADDDSDSVNYWKQEMNFLNGATSPTFATGWSKGDRNLLNPADVDTWEPLRPARYGDFQIRTGVWTKYWIEIVEGLPLNALEGHINVWMADEERDPYHVLGPIRLKVPWRTDQNRGIWRLNLKFSAKGREADSPAVDFWMKNFLVLKNTPLSTLLQRPQKGTL